MPELPIKLTLTKKKQLFNTSHMSTVHVYGICTIYCMTVEGDQLKAAS